MIIACLLFVQYANSQGRDERQQKKAEKQKRINQLIKQEEEGAIIFNKQSVFAIKLNTDGYGIFYEIGKQKTIRTASIFQFELGERKHPKEERITPGQGLFLSNPYVYGKINNFYYFKTGYLQQRLIGGKGNKNGVAVSVLYGGGLTLALMKPYYLKVQDLNTGEISDIKYENNDSIFLDPLAIRGSSGFTMGFGEVKLKPGGFAKTALRFDYGRYNEVVSALEVGINVEFYAQKIPHMLRNKDNQLFFNAYAAILFGKRK